VGASAIDVVAFRVGARHFGVPVAQVDQVFPVAEIAQLTDAPESIRGLVTIAGIATPVVDLQRRLEGRWSELRLQQRLILVRESTRRFALLADDVAGVTTLSEAELAVADVPTYDGFIYTRLCEVAGLLSASEEAQLAAALQQRCLAS
jgi:chemotaxis signal transduction protein